MANREGIGPTNFRSFTGRTRAGQPLAFNHAPAADLAPWFTWFSVSDAELPLGVVLSDGMLNDHTCLRVLFGGRWTAQTRDGLQTFVPGERGMTLYFGPHSQILPITVEGSFKVMTVHLTPGATAVLGGPPQADVLDRILDHDVLVGHGSLATRFDPSGAPQDWLGAFEQELRKFVARNASRAPDPLTLAFERQTLADPSVLLADFARQQGVAPRTVERVVQRDYGLAPRMVARRARALDLAAALLGVAMEEEEAALRLRYFDQSHQIREIRRFFDCTPGQLQGEPHALLRLNLEVRQARRIEALALLPPDTIQPWRDPGAEPGR